MLLESTGRIKKLGKIETRQRIITPKCVKKVATVIPAGLVPFHVSFKSLSHKKSNSFNGLTLGNDALAIVLP